MSNRRGLIPGFLLGVVVTLIVAAGVGYSVYNQIQKKISDESVRETAEETLARLMGGTVEVRDGEISLPNLLTLSDVTLAGDSGEVFAFDRIELIAEGGVQGLQEGQFGQVILTNPTIHLERYQKSWNLIEFLKPVMAQPSHSEEIQSGTGDTTASEKKPLPLKLVKIVGLDFQVALRDENIYSGVEAAEVTLSRKDLESPWAVHCKDGSLRLNPSAEVWPLAETYKGLSALMASSGETATNPPTDPSAFQSPSWLGDVILEDFDLEFIHPNQRLAINGLSMQADEMLELIRLQSGTLEKKTPLPKT